MSLAFDELAEGRELTPLVVGPVERSDFIRYAGASGDFNPNHTIDAAAQVAGFPSVFAHGMFHAGIMASFLVDAFGPTSVRCFRVQFREQVWPGDVLTFTGRVVAKDAAARTVDLELRCSRQTDGVALLGWATVTY